MEISMLKSVIQQATNCNSSEVVPDARLITDLKMDASGAIVCSQQIKGVLQVTIQPDEVLKAETVGNLLKIINVKRKEAGKTMTIDRTEILSATIVEETTTTKKGSKTNKVMWELEMFLGLMIIVVSIIMAIGHGLPGLRDILAIQNRTNNVYNIAIPLLAAIGGLMIGWGWKKLHDKKR